MSEKKRRPGRPRTRTDEPPGDYVGFRAPRALKAQLSAAASASGRSLSTEAQFRLERSFQNEELLPQILDLAYGPEASGLIMALGECIKDSGPYIATFSGEDLGQPARWMASPWAFRQMKAAIQIILEDLEPIGTENAELPATIAALPEPSRSLMGAIGPNTARTILNWLRASADSAGTGPKMMRLARDRLIEAINRSGPQQ